MYYVITEFITDIMLTVEEDSVAERRIHCI